MLNTLTEATFKYKNYSVTARPIMDNASEKFFCWQGFLFKHSTIGDQAVKSPTNYTVAARTIKTFEEQFILLADKLNMPSAEPKATATTNSLEEIPADVEYSAELDW